MKKKSKKSSYEKLCEKIRKIEKNIFNLSPEECKNNSKEKKKIKKSQKKKSPKATKSPKITKSPKAIKTRCYKINDRKKFLSVYLNDDEIKRFKELIKNRKESKQNYEKSSITREALDLLYCFEIFGVDAI